MIRLSLKILENFLCLFFWGGFWVTYITFIQISFSVLFSDFAEPHPVFEQVLGQEKLAIIFYVLAAYSGGNICCHNDSTLLKRLAVSQSAFLK